MADGPAGRPRGVAVRGGPDGDPSPVLSSRTEDLEERLDEAERSARRETLWLAIGVTPATLLPAGIAAAHGHDLLALALVMGGFAIQGVRWARSARQVRRISADLEEARSADGTRPPPSGLSAPGGADDHR